VLLFKRILLILGSVLLAGLVAVLLLLPAVLVQAGEWIARLDAPIRLLVVVCIDLLILGAAVWRFWSLEEGEAGDLVARVDGRRVNINPQAAAEKIRKALLVVPAVVEAEAAVRSLRGRAIVRLDVWLDASCDDYAAKQRDILRQVERVVLKQLGIRFAGAPEIYLYAEAQQQSRPSSKGNVTNEGVQPAAMASADVGVKSSF
jgi:hypothetical protein